MVDETGQKSSPLEREGTLKCAVQPQTSPPPREEWGRTGIQRKATASFTERVSGIQIGSDSPQATLMI
jgi:hypothetical protein